MPTSPSTRRPKPSTTPPTVRQWKLKDVGDASPAITIEQNTDEQTTNEQTMDDTRNNGIKGRAMASGIETNMSAINTPIDDLHDDAPSGLTKLFTRVLVLLAFSLPFIRLPAFALPAARPLKSFSLALMAALYPFLYLLGFLYLGSRLLYALCQDILALLRILRPGPGPLKVIRQDFLTLLGLFFYPVLRLFNFISQHSPASLRTFSQTLPGRFWGLPDTFCSSFSPSKRQTRLGRVCRWLLIAYVTWIGFTYTISLAFDYRQDALLDMVCATPYVGPQLVLCQPAGLSSPQGSDLLAGIALPREKLANAAKCVGRDHELAWHMLGHHDVLHDLKARVELGQLSDRTKLQLDGPLTRLINDTWTTARLLAQFTSSIDDSIDLIKILDAHTIDLLDEVARDTKIQPRGTETLLSHILAAIHPLAGMVAHISPALKVKRLLKSTEKEFSKNIDGLLDEADALLIVLLQIHKDLRAIEEATKGEVVTTFTGLNILQDLWIFVTRKMDINVDTYGQRKLLGDITRFYHVANGMVRDIRASLLQAKAEMRTFRIIRFRTNTLLEAHPPHVIAAMLRRSTEMLEASTEKFEGTGTRIAEVLPKRKGKAS